MPSFARPAVLILAALSLAACGSVHPGDAAVVDGHAISMQVADESSEAYCALAVLTAAQQGVTDVPSADSRRQAVRTLVTLAVARDLADELGLAPKESDYTLPRSDRDQIASALKDADDDELEHVYTALQDNQELTLIAASLGAHATGQTLSEQNRESLTSAGLTEIDKAFADHDVDIDPRFDLKLPLATDAKPGTGSLSATAVKAAADDADVPVALRCS